MLAKLFVIFLVSVFLVMIFLVARIKYSEYQLRKLKGKSRAAHKDYVKVQEALELLDLSKNPTKNEIDQAYKRMMRVYHPDRGGSKFVAARINVARDVLLKKVA